MKKSTHRKRVSIEIDDALIMSLKELTGIQNVSEIVDLALRDMLKRCQLRRFDSIRHEGMWEGDLDELRKGRYL